MNDYPLQAGWKKLNSGHSVRYYFGLRGQTKTTLDKVGHFREKEALLLCKLFTLCPPYCWSASLLPLLIFGPSVKTFWSNVSVYFKYMCILRQTANRQTKTRLHKKRLSICRAVRGAEKTLEISVLRGHLWVMQVCLSLLWRILL